MLSVTQETCSQHPEEENSGLKTVRKEMRNTEEKFWWLESQKKKGGEKNISYSKRAHLLSEVSRRQASANSTSRALRNFSVGVCVYRHVKVPSVVLQDSDKGCVVTLNWNFILFTLRGNLWWSLNCRKNVGNYRMKTNLPNLITIKGGWTQLFHVVTISGVCLPTKSSVDSVRLWVWEGQGRCQSMADHF